MSEVNNREIEGIWKMSLIVVCILLWSQIQVYAESPSSDYGEWYGHTRNDVWDADAYFEEIGLLEERKCIELYVGNIDDATRIWAHSLLLKGGTVEEPLTLDDVTPIWSKLPIYLTETDGKMYVVDEIGIHELLYAYPWMKDRCTKWQSLSINPYEEAFK